MRHPGTGRFDKPNMPAHLRRLAPSEAAPNLVSVDLAQLVAEGRKLVLLDVDNTILPWKTEEVEEEVLTWLKQGKDLGLQFCVISNTRRPERLARICGSLGIEFVRGKFKPSPAMYRAALEKYKLEPSQAIMVGDQLLTDVLGANQAGIDAIWLKKISSKEFVGTRLVSRNIERIVGLLLHRWFQSDEKADRPGFFQRTVLRQLVKFGVVGGTATVVDLGLHYYLMTRATWNGGSLRDAVGNWVISSFGMQGPIDDHRLSDAAWLPTKIVPVLLAILVSYFLNFAWTFRQKDASVSITQAGKFYIVALIGMVISLVASTLVKGALHGSFAADFAIASLAGIVAGFAWNFNAQRIWTFGAHKK